VEKSRKTEESERRMRATPYIRLGIMSSHLEHRTVRKQPCFGGSLWKGSGKLRKEPF
jgi:hypothetical protein